MLKKLFKKTNAKKTIKIEKISKKEMDKVIGGAESLSTVHQELHRPTTI